MAYSISSALENRPTAPMCRQWGPEQSRTVQSSTTPTYMYIWKQGGAVIPQPCAMAANYLVLSCRLWLSRDRYKAAGFGIHSWQLWHFMKPLKTLNTSGFHISFPFILVSVNWILVILIIICSYVQTHLHVSVSHVKGCYKVANAQGIFKSRIKSNNNSVVNCYNNFTISESTCKTMERLKKSMYQIAGLTQTKGTVPMCSSC